MLELDKGDSLPLLYHLSFIVGLVEEGFYYGIQARRSRVRALIMYIFRCVYFPLIKVHTVGLV
jgi:hypothetical protein